MMSKRVGILIGLVVLFGGVINSMGYTFTLPDGRSLEAEIVQYDERLGQVELKRTEGKLVKIKPSVFVKSDQDYILDWAASRAFMSPAKLKVEADDRTVKSWKEEEYEDVRYSNGDVERELMKETRFEEQVYEIELFNKSDIAIEDVYIEYVVFYEQSKETYSKPVMEQKTKRGKIEINRLAGKTSVVKSTDEVKTHKDNIMSKNWVSGRSRTGGKGRVNGMRARLCKKLPEGEVVFRSFSSPTSLSESRYPWPD